MTGKMRMAYPLIAFVALCCLSLLLSVAPPTVTRTTAAVREFAPARRVIASSPILAAYLSIDQTPAHIVGASELSLRELAKVAWLWASLSRHQIQSVGDGFTLSTEEVLGLSPDALFVPYGAAEYWRSLGLPIVVEVGVDAQAPQKSVRDIWNRMGEISGHGGRVDMLWQKALAAMRSRRLSVEGGDKVSAMVLRVDASGEITQLGRYSTFATRLSDKGLNLVGGVSGPLDIEQLLLSDPEMILISSDVQTKERDSPVTLLLKSKAYQALRAIKEQRIYQMPIVTFMNEPVEDPLLSQWVAEIIYRGRIGCNLRARYRETYKELFGYEISDDEIDTLISLTANQFAADYDRFRRDAKSTSVCIMHEGAHAG